MSMVNSIASAATAQSQATLQQQHGVAMAQKSQQVMKQQGEAALSMLESATRTQDQMVARGASAPHLGNTLDVSG